MKFGIKTLDDFDYKGKIVLLRVDINEPLDKNTKEILDITRIKACVPTIEELKRKKAKIVILAHQGSDIEYKNFYSTKQHSEILSEMLKTKVKWVEDVCGPLARKTISELKEGDILLLDNVRYVSEEQTLFEIKLKLTHQQQAKTQIVAKLSPLADFYVCDAFAAAHRDQPTLCGFQQILPSAMGRLFEKEYSVISELMENPQRPCVYVLGGAKVSDAFLMMENVLESNKADIIITGGLVGNIILFSIGKDIGKGSVDYIINSNYGEYIEKARDIFNKYPNRIKLPIDISFLENDNRKSADIGESMGDLTALDIGDRTAKLYADIISEAKTVFVNGPMGVFEQKQTEYGTKVVFEAISNTKAYTVVGGGDSITAINKYKLEKNISYICTGGGALIRFLSGKQLPVVTALVHGSKL